MNSIGCLEQSVKSTCLSDLSMWSVRTLIVSLTTLTQCSNVDDDHTLYSWWKQNDEDLSTRLMYYRAEEIRNHKCCSDSIRA